MNKLLLLESNSTTLLGQYLSPYINIYNLTFNNTYTLIFIIIIFILYRCKNTFVLIAYTTYVAWCIFMEPSIEKIREKFKELIPINEFYRILVFRNIIISNVASWYKCKFVINANTEENNYFMIERLRTVVIRKVGSKGNLEGIEEDCETLKCHDNNLTSLKGCPKTVKVLLLQNCNLQNLEHCPDDLIYLDCTGNRELNSLEGLNKNIIYLFYKNTKISINEYSKEDFPNLDFFKTDNPLLLD